MLAGLALSAISTGISVSQQKKAAEAAQAANDRQNEANTALNRSLLEQSKQDYFNTSSGKSILNKLNEEYTSRLKGLNSSATKTGATTESKLANAENLQKSKANMLSSIVSNADQRKDRAEQQYAYRQGAENNRYMTGLQDYYNMSGQAAKNAWDNVSNAGMNVATNVEDKDWKNGFKDFKKS